MYLYIYIYKTLPRSWSVTVQLSIYTATNIICLTSTTVYERATYIGLSYANISLSHQIRRPSFPSCASLPQDSSPFEVSTSHSSVQIPNESLYSPNLGQPVFSPTPSTNCLPETSVDLPIHSVSHIFTQTGLVVNGLSYPPSVFGKQG